MNRQKDLYFVAVKLFLENQEGRLFIVKDRFGDWDLPGGRLRNEDFDVSFEGVIERKMCEELGESIRYVVGDPVVFMRHERDELLSDGTKENRRIFAIGYRARYLGGEIMLGENHEKFEWVERSFIPENYFTGGWLKGVNEFLKKNIH